MKEWLPSAAAAGRGKVDREGVALRALGCVVALVLALGSTSAAQELDRSVASPYFECPYVNFFDSDCPQLQEEEEAVRRIPRGEVEDRRRGQRGDDRRGDEEREDEGGLIPDEVVLFPRQSMAPDTPPLYRELLENPTLENARRYVLWHAERTARVALGQALIRTAGEELAVRLAEVSLSVQRELETVLGAGR